MGGTTSTTNTSTSGMNNAALNSAVTTIGNQLNTQLGAGSKVFEKSMYPGISSQTSNAANSLYSNPMNAGFSQSVGDTMGEMGAIASGQRFGNNDPSYALMRQNLMDDAVKNVGSAFTSSGRFGGGSYVDTATDSAFNAAAGLDVQNRQSDIARQQFATQALPGLYSAGTLPMQAQLQAGQIFDADALATRSGEADLYDRTNNAGWNTLQRGSTVLAGTAPSAGTTSSNTTSQQVPWYMSALGIGAGLASFI
jgi:hypothetical protein